MVCTSVKKGVDCLFMDSKGCQFNGGGCHPIIEQCNGCQRTREFPTGMYCLSFPDPSIKWRVGSCSMATHVIKASSTKATEKLNPLKASKRQAR
jgi:hypothetical protein